MVARHLCQTLLHGLPVDQEKIEETITQIRVFDACLFQLRQTKVFNTYLGETKKNLQGLCSFYVKSCSFYTVSIYLERLQAEVNNLATLADSSPKQDEARAEACFNRHMELAIEKKKEVNPVKKQHIIDLIKKLGVFERFTKEEMTLSDVNAFIKKLLLGGVFYDLCSLFAKTDATKLKQKDFQNLLQLSLSGSREALEKKKEDIKRITDAIHKDPFLLISCLVPAFIQSLIPNGSEQNQKLIKFTKALESFRPVFKRLVAEEIQNKSVDPLVQVLLNFALSEMSEKEFLHISITPFITFFSALAKGENTENPDGTFIKQGLDWLVDEVEKARQLWQSLEGNSDQKKKKAIENRNGGNLSPIEEFLLIDLSDLGKGVSIASFFLPIGLPLLDSKKGREVAAGFMQLLNGASKLFTRKTISDHALDDLKKENPNSLIVKFLDKLEFEEKQRISEKIEKDMLPLLLLLIPILDGKHDLKAYLPYLETLKAAVQSDKTIDRDTIFKTFASIFQQLLGEIECHYAPALESVCKAFWEIGGSPNGT